MDKEDIKEIEEIFVRHIGILSEGFQHKLDIVAEGHQMLSEKLDAVESRLDKRIDRVESRLDRVESKLDHVENRLDRVEKKIDSVDAKLSKKIDDLSADLTAHRTDTEMHRAGYQVRENPDPVDRCRFYALLSRNTDNRLFMIYPSL